MSVVIRSTTAPGQLIFAVRARMNSLDRDIRTERRVPA
jgi:hypothetical protein